MMNLPTNSRKHYQQHSSRCSSLYYRIPTRIEHHKIKQLLNM